MIDLFPTEVASFVDCPILSSVSVIAFILKELNKKLKHLHPVLHGKPLVLLSV
jgi:hypothetical protein